MATVLRSPLGQRIWRPDSRAALDASWIQYPYDQLGAGAQPFSLAEQPNPILRRMAQQDVGRQGLTLFSTPSPFAQGDWPNPTTQRRLTLQEPGYQVLALQTPQTPFLQSDWPVPIGYRQPISNKTHLDPLKLNLTGQDALPAAHSFDYPNPRVAGRLTPPPGTTGLSLYAVIVPFHLADQPNPLRPHPSRWQMGYEQRWYGLFPAPPRPFVLNDQPNPRGYLPSVSLKTFLGPLNPNLKESPNQFGFPLRNQPNPNRDPRLSLGGSLYSLSIGRVVPAVIVFQPSLIRTILNLDQTQLQINTALTALAAQLPAYGSSLPSPAGYSEGKLFTVIPAQWVYQIQGAAWVRIK